MENRLIKINYPATGNYSQFTYDGWDQLVKILEYSSGTLNSTKIVCWVSRGMAEIRDASGSLVYQYFERGQVNFVGAATNYFYAKDKLGSVREMTDSSGNIASEIMFDPFGKSTRLAGSLSPDFQFAGYYYHTASGLSLTLNRAYSPNLGRWINRDPAGIRGGVNLFAYVHNRPTLFADPTGLDDRHGGVSSDDTPVIQKPAPPGVDTPGDATNRYPGNPYPAGLHPELPCVPDPGCPGRAANPDGQPGPDGKNSWVAPDGTKFTPEGRRVCDTGPPRKEPDPPPTS